MAEEIGYDESLKILGLNRNYTAEQLKENFRAAVLKNHPDKGGSTEKMTRINLANDYLERALNNMFLRTPVSVPKHTPKYTPTSVPKYTPVDVSEYTSYNTSNESYGDSSNGKWYSKAEDEIKEVWGDKWRSKDEDRSTRSSDGRVWVSTKVRYLIIELEAIIMHVGKLKNYIIIRCVKGAPVLLRVDVCTKLREFVDRLKAGESASVVRPLVLVFLDQFIERVLKHTKESLGSSDMSDVEHIMSINFHITSIKIV